MTDVGKLARVAVVIPTFNRCEKLLRTLHAVAEADIAGLDAELHVVDDGSTDGTEPAMTKLFSGFGAGVRAQYHRQTHCGPAAARNLAIGATDAPVIVFLDDDCVPSRGWLRALVARFADPEVAGVGGRFVPGAAATLVARYLEYRGVNQYPSPRRPFRFPLGGNCAYRREVLEALRGFDAVYRAAATEDTDLARRAVEAGFRLVYEPEAEVQDFNEETLRALLRRGFQRGQDATLKQAVWSKNGKPRLLGVVGDVGRVLFTALLLPLSPLRMPVPLRRGVPARDALPFAVLSQLVRIVRRSGCVWMAIRLYSGATAVKKNRRM